MSTLATAGLAPITSAHAATGNTIYVGNNGTNACSDSGTGSATDPFCTFPTAMSAAGPGDTIAVYSLYNTELDVTKSGTPGAPITVKPVTDSFGRTSPISSPAHAAVVNDQHDVVIEGFTASGPSSATDTFVISGNSTRVTLTGNRIESSGSGVAISGGATGNVVAGNYITNAKGGVKITDSPDNEITGNTVVDGFNVGIGVYGVSTGTTIANNISTGTRTLSSAQPVEISVDTAAESRTAVHHNIVDPAPRSNDPDTGAPLPAGAPYSWGGTAYPDVASFAAHSGRGAFDLMTDPRLNPDNEEPLPGSPAIDSADSSAPGALPTDLNGNPRVDDPQVGDTGTGPETYYDRGAAEYQGGPVTKASISITGTATSETITVDARASIAGFTPIASYTADFNGTKVTSTNPVFSQTFPVSSDPSKTQGQYLYVTATGQDGKAGSTAVQSYELGTVIQPTPVLTLTADPSTPGGIIADPTASAPPPDLNGGDNGSFISIYTVDWGDGSTPYVQNAPVTPIPHTYTKSGTYPVTLTVTTGTLQSASITREIAVTVPPPVTTPPPTGTPVGPTPPSGTPGHATVTRLGGTTRYGTALDVSAAQWKDGAAGGVVIARGDAAPDALAGVPLAAHVHGPLLLTDPKSLDGATAAEIKRVLGADKTKTITLLGGTTAVSPAVQAQLTALGYHVQRIGGSDRFDTALRIAGEGLGPTANVVVATGTDFADALAAGPLAAAQHAAVVLSDGPVLNPATAAFVAAHSHVTAVGGAAVTAVAKAAPGKAATDLWGGDRYATAVKVGEAMTAGHAPVAVGLASGTVFPDALTGGAYAANAGVPLLLTDPKQLPPNVSGLLALWKQQLAAVEIFGGPVAVSTGVQSSVVTTVGGHAG
ncbi:putative cell wall-binding protein [Catenulispora sp. GAS73]|uniref:cell wall-binding repeat-containing protein n=1 Tax=Catenulispora sp. GAS73 TaxID=3156269 RepID=UPI00351830F6